MRKFNTQNIYDNGILKLKMLYTDLFDVLPDNFQHYDESLKMDTNFFTWEICKELFGENIDVQITSTRSIFSTSKEDENERWDDNTHRWKSKLYPSIDVINYDENWILNIDYNSIYCLSHRFDAKELIDKILAIVPRQPDVSRIASVDLVAYDHNYYTINSKIRTTTIDFDTHYNDDIKDMYKDLLSFLNEKASGLAILRGIVGSGKSYFIRHLLSNTDKKYILVTNAIASHMAEPEFIAFMMEHKDSVFILEDCEQILMAREENRFGGAIANILNMSDGLMSDIFNIKFICTFNTDIKNIDEALLRPGRCFVNYEFKSLCAEKSVKLLESFGHQIDKPRELTLAQIYNFENIKLEDKPTYKPIGFR